MGQWGDCGCDRRADDTQQQLNLLARDQFLGKPFAGIWNGAVVTPNELDFDPGRQLLFVLLDVEIDAFLHLIACLGEKTRTAVDQTDLDGLCQNFRRISAHSQAGDQRTDHCLQRTCLFHP